jgi:hypothetical protein
MRKHNVMSNFNIKINLSGNTNYCVDEVLNCVHTFACFLLEISGVIH